jgi:hypothetical protein
MDWYVDAAIKHIPDPRSADMDDPDFLPVIKRHLYISGEMIVTRLCRMSACRRKGKWTWSVKRVHAPPPPAFAWYGYSQEETWKDWERFDDADDARAFCVRMLGRDEGERAFYGLMHAKLVKA